MSGSCLADPEHGGGVGSHLQPGEIPHYQRGTGGEYSSPQHMLEDVIFPWALRNLGWEWGLVPEFGFYPPQDAQGDCSECCWALCLLLPFPQCTVIQKAS